MECHQGHGNPADCVSSCTEIECTCGTTWADRADFDRHQDQVIQERGTVSGHWEVGTI